MRRLVLLIMALLVAGTAMAAQITINVPDAEVSDARDICEILRKRMLIQTTEWGDKVCAEELFRRGLRQVKGLVVEWQAEQTKQDTIVTEATAFDDRFPAFESRPGRETVPTPMQCGNGVIESDATIPYVEECDDGNVVGGDGCSENCLNE